MIKIPLTSIRYFKGYGKTLITELKKLVRLTKKKKKRKNGVGKLLMIMCYLIYNRIDECSVKFRG